MQVYNYDPQTHEYIGEGQAQVNPRNPSNPLIPANATKEKPPATEAGTVTLFIDGKWLTKPDHRGKKGYQKENRKEVLITQPGELPEYLTIQQPLTEWDEWQVKQGNWQTNTQSRRKELCHHYCSQLDQFASQVRQRFISGQADVIDEYKLAEDEALAFKASNYHGEVPETIQIDMDTYNRDAETATDRILAEATIMRSALRAVRAIRLPAKEAIKALPESTTEEEFRKEFDSWQTKLDAIKPPQ